MRWDRPSPVQSAPTPMAGVPAQRRAQPAPADALSDAPADARTEPDAIRGAGVAVVPPRPAVPAADLAPPAGARTFVRGPNPAGAGRAESEIVMRTVAGPGDLARRVAALLLPSPWALLTIGIWWAWRVVMLVALGVELAAHPGPTAWGLFCDAAFVFGVFAGVRSAVLARSASLDFGTVTARVVMVAAAVLLGVAVLLRIIDMVHCAVEHAPVTAAFWGDVLDAPGQWLTTGAAIVTGLTAAAIAVLTWFALVGDLEHVQAAAEPLGASATFGAVHVCAIVALAVATAVAAEAAVAPPPLHDAGRLPEIHTLLTLQATLAARARAEPARLDM